MGPARARTQGPKEPTRRPTCNNLCSPNERRRRDPGHVDTSGHGTCGHTTRHARARTVVQCSAPGCGLSRAAATKAARRVVCYNGVPSCTVCRAHASRDAECGAASMRVKSLRIRTPPLDRESIRRINPTRRESPATPRVGASAWGRARMGIPATACAPARNPDAPPLLESGLREGRGNERDRKGSQRPPLLESGPEE